MTTRHEATIARLRALQQKEERDDGPAYVRQLDERGPGATAVIEVDGLRRGTSDLHGLSVPASVVRRDGNGDIVGSFYLLENSRLYMILSGKGYWWYTVPRRGCCVPVALEQAVRLAQEMKRRRPRA